MLQSNLYEISREPFAGALVELRHINSFGNAHCRFARNFIAFRTGEIIVINPDNLQPVEDKETAKR